MNKSNKDIGFQKAFQIDSSSFQSVDNDEDADSEEMDQEHYWLTSGMQSNWSESLQIRYFRKRSR